MQIDYLCSTQINNASFVGLHYYQKLSTGSKCRSWKNWCLRCSPESLFGAKNDVIEAVPGGGKSPSSSSSSSLKMCKEIYQIWKLVRQKADSMWIFNKTFGVLLREINHLFSMIAIFFLILNSDCLPMHRDCFVFQDIATSWPAKSDKLRKAKNLVWWIS